MWGAGSRDYLSPLYKPWHSNGTVTAFLEDGMILLLGHQDVPTLQTVQDPIPDAGKFIYSYASPQCETPHLQRWAYRNIIMCAWL